MDKAIKVVCVGGPRDGTRADGRMEAFSCVADIQVSVDGSLLMALYRQVGGVFVFDCYWKNGGLRTYGFQ